MTAGHCTDIYNYIYTYDLHYYIAPFAMPLGHQNFFMLKYRFCSIQSNFRFLKNAI